MRRATFCHLIRNLRPADYPPLHFAQLCLASSPSHTLSLSLSLSSGYCLLCLSAALQLSIAQNNHLSS